MTLLYTPDGYLIAMGLWLLFGIAVLAVCLKLRRRFRKQPRKLKWINATLSAWVFLATLTLLEIGFALFYDQTDSFSLSNASERWYKMHVRINSDGYRDARPFRTTTRHGQRRILFAGDSFTFGHGVRNVEDRFSDKIAARLEQARPGEFVVSNVALPGLDLRKLCDAQLPEWIRDRVDVDVLVYTFVLNDIENFDERTAVHYSDIERMKPRFFLFRETYFFNLLYFRLLQFSRPEVRGYYSYLQESYESQAWERLERKLDELHELCTEHGIDLRIVIFPFLHNLEGDYPFHTAHRQLVHFFRERGIRHLDLEGVLRPHVSEGLTVNRYDAHPNERAHAIAAEAIEQHLLDDLFGFQ